ncbi:AAA family ATPase [Chamaesiphon sp.]|uniref:AAA family ATPase n=1 Tax=Chamaesiphon sp. TaxID=2814140 RepID=UPI0035946C3E
MDAIDVLTQPKESVSHDRLRSAIDTLSRADLKLTQELLHSVIAALSNPKEQLDELTTVINGMFAAIIQIQAETEILKLDQVSSFIAWVRDRVEMREPGKAIGETGVGKTCACKFCQQEFKSNQENTNQLPEIPMLYIEIGDKKRTAIQFLQLILIALKKPTSGTSMQLKQRVKKFLKQYKVRAILIDEAHDLHYDALKTVRNLYDDDDLKVIPIVIGTSNRLDSLIEKDKEFKRRFSNTFFFEEFTGDKLKEILKLWGKYYIQMPDPLNTGRTVPLLKYQKNNVDSSKAEIDKELFVELETMTLGDLGSLDKILRNAAKKLLKNKLNEIYYKILKALETEERIVKINAKTILKKTKIDKSIIETIQGSYPRSDNALN